MIVFLTQLIWGALPAAACAVCGNLGDDPAAGAILAGTGLLSAAPILSIGGGVYYVYRKTKQAREAEEKQASQAASDTSPFTSAH